MRKIEVVPYNPLWSLLYAKEDHKLYAILKDEVALLTHIGSTAIPGLAAKPTIDILIGVKDINKIDNYNNLMEQLGYIAKDEFEGTPLIR